MRNLIRKILKESVSEETIRMVKPGSHVLIKKVNHSLIDCEPMAYHILENLSNQMCEVIAIDDNAQLSDDECLDYIGWGMLIKSDKIIRGHYGYGADIDNPTKCGESDCYWVNQYYVDFELLDASFDTESVFSQLYEQEEGEFDWVGDILNEEVPKWVRITAGLRFKIPTIERYKEWQITNGQTHPEHQWQKIKSIEYVDGIKCYVYDFAGYKNMITPIADFNEEEDLSYGDLKPRYLNRDRDNPKFSIIKKSNT